MKEKSYLATVLYADGAANRFVVLSTSHREGIIYGYWKVFRDAGFNSVQPGQKFEVRMESDSRDNQTPIVNRVLGEVDETRGQADQAEYMEDVHPQSFSVEELRSELCNNQEGMIVVYNAIIEESEIRNILISVPVVFIDCLFQGNFRLLDTRIQGGIWFVSCAFKFHFSLRGTHLDGNAMLFNCDFRGLGGISFRGLHGRSIFLGYGTRGGDDMLWLNELSLSGCVAITGIFSTRVELLARQDDNPVNSTPTLHRVLIGNSDYIHEKLNENQFHDGIECRGYRIQGGFEIHNSTLNELILGDMDTKHVLIDKCEISRDIILNNLRFQEETKTISIIGCVIERHLRVSARELRGCVDLSDTTVAQTFTFELDNPNAGVPRLRLNRFHANAAQFEPVELVYGAVRRRRLFAPPVFGFLEGAVESGRITGERRRTLAEAYTSCKNWLAASGHLLEEDHAFFHMRNAKESCLLKRWLFGGIFGWGIHLWNILLSAVVLILVFALFYTYMGTGAFLEMILLSAQSFISSFFGQWPNYPPTGVLSILITLESMLGVVFITVLVGAYIRKMLR